jgi:capsular polysaccharide biosynthesis protein
MLVKQLAKSTLRGLAAATHQLGYDSRQFGPPRGQASSYALAQDTQARLTLHNLRNEALIKRTLPNTLESEIHPKFYCDLERQASACYVAELGKGRTIGSQGVVLSASDHILQDLAPVIASSTPNYRELYTLRFPKLTAVSGRVGLVAGSGGEGYFHWLYDVFPKLALLNQLPERPEYYIVGHYDKAFVQQSLAAYGLSQEQIIPAHHRSHFEAETLLAASPPCLTGNPPAWIIEFLRDVFLKNVGQSSHSSAKRLYISRRDATYRRVLNEVAVEDFLKDYGFESITLGGQSLQAQAQLFHQADVIVASHGAGLSNLAFCRPGATVIEMFAPDYVNVCYWSISNLMNLNYWYLIGHQATESSHHSRPDFAASMQIDLEKLSELLRISLKD